MCHSIAVGLYEGFADVVVVSPTFIGKKLTELRMSSAIITNTSYFLICVRAHSSIILELGEPDKTSALTRVGVFVCPLGHWNSYAMLGKHTTAYRRDHKDSRVLGGKPSNLRVGDGFTTPQPCG